MKDQNDFDKTQEYEEGIIDLISKLRVECNRAQMPMFVSVCLKNNKKESVYKSEMVGTASSGIKLTDDKIVKFVSVLNGFDTVPKRDDTFDAFDEI